ncbi:MAG TPA: multicopper oxidase domain-containing protein [Terracidiphilus sp.]
MKIKPITRRRFLSSSGLAVAGVALRGRFSSVAIAETKAPILDPTTLVPFVDPLPIPPVARSVGTRLDPDDATRQIPFYQLAIAETLQKVHRDLAPTRMWTIGGSFPGATLETEIAQGMMVEWQNRLPARHLFAIDHSLHGAGKDIPDVRSVVHLHGGRTPAAGDGYPEEWVVPGHSQIYHYPCLQHAATLFYHDHTMGINRLNTYAGMVGFCILRDRREDALGLPTGRYDIPLHICDRILRTDGQLDYPVSMKPGEVWVPEVFGDSILANGKLLPYLDVEPTLYRFRVMNGANGRFFRFSLANKAGFYQIASDQGLLSAPVLMTRVVMAPAERADLLIDFSAMAGEHVKLMSDSFTILQFRVGAKALGKNSAAAIPAALHETPRLEESSTVRTRRLTLDERMDPVQRSMGMLLNNTPWHAPITEKPELNTIEIWELVNLTDDSHPIHLHLVRFQVLDRRRFDTFEFQSTGKMRYTGEPQLPAPEERGWKDTVRADPAMVTRIIVPFEGYAGRYVWHCHILEHEDNEMMRPYEVVAAGTTGQ